MRAWALALSVGLTACGLSRPPLDYGDAGLGEAPLSHVPIQEDFRPGLLVLDFHGDLVAADADQAVLYTLDPTTLSVLQTDDVGGGGPWEPLQISQGRMGNGYLLTGAGEVLKLDLNEGGASSFANLGAPPVAFVARRDDDGVLAAQTSADVSVLDGHAALVGTLHAPEGYAISALASDSNGKTYAGLVGDGGCNGLAVLGGDAGMLSRAFGAGPCVMALSGNNQTLWLAASGDGGAALYQILTRSLPDASAVEAEYTVPALTPVQLVLHSDEVSGEVVSVGIRGARPGPTIGKALVSALASGLVFQTIAANAITGPTDMAFGDDGQLYVADPISPGIVVVR